MPRRAAAYLQQFADEWIVARRARVARGLVGDRADDRRSAGADPGRGDGVDLHAPERHRRAGDRRVVLTATTGRAAGSSWRISSSRRTCTCSKASAATAPRSSTSQSDDALRTNLRAAARCDRRADGARADLAGAVQELVRRRTIGAIVEKAHRVGARVVLDVYQGAGTVPMNLGALGVDFAVGGSVKWLCGGPGAGYLYVRPDLAPALEPGIVGWAAHARPFEFATGAIDYAGAPERFQSGTPERAGALRVPGGLRNRRGDRRRRDSREVAAADPADHRARTRGRFPNQYPGGRPGARRRRHHRRARTARPLRLS